MAEDPPTMDVLLLGIDGRETNSDERSQNKRPKRSTTTTTTMEDDENTTGDPPGRRGSECRTAMSNQESTVATTTQAPSTSTQNHSSTVAATTIFKKSKHVKSKHMDPKILATRRKIQFCCKTNDLATALELYHEALASNTQIETQTFYNLINLCDGLDTKRIHIGTPNHVNDTTTSTTMANNNHTSNNTTKEDETTTNTTENTTTNTSIRPVDAEARKQAAFEIKQQMDLHKIPLNESAYTALVKVLCRCGMDDTNSQEDLKAAQQFVQEAESVQQCRVKIRLYSPLLVAYCQKGLLQDALQVWQRVVAQAQDNLQLTEKIYTALLQCCHLYCAKDDDNNKNTDATTRIRIRDAAVVVQKVLTDLSEDVVVPSKETCAALIQWFESPFATTSVAAAAAGTDNDDDADNNHDEQDKQSLLSKVSLPPTHVDHNRDGPIGPVQCPPGHQWVITSECPIDTQTGKLLGGCLSGHVLKPVQLTEAAWKEMISMNETIALAGKLEQDTSQFLGGKKGKKRKFGQDDQQQRTKAWKHFADYLQQKLGRNDNNNNQEQHSTPQENLDVVIDGANVGYTRPQKPKLDVVIDGANVGYFQQNFSGAPKHVDYHQIDSIVQHFLKDHDNNNKNDKTTTKKNVLLVMHQRHFMPNLMPKRFIPLVQSWERAGILYKTPAGMNDDWFWMHAALLSGPGTLVLTNDEMRDHHFQMLAPRTFLRWKDRHQVHFHFGGELYDNHRNGNNNKNNGGGQHRHRGREVFLVYPDVYSRRIQRLEDGYVIPLAKRGDENRFLDGVHVAEEDVPEEETYLCIRPTPVS